MEKPTLFQLSWQKYLNLLFLLLGVGLFLSGVVTWIAANWDVFSKFTKLYATQGLFAVMVLLGLYFYARENQKRLKLKAGAFYFSASVLIGALFALLGQIYQTGADTWQLFALWSVCQLPFFLCLPNVASGILLIATSNLAVLILHGTKQLDTSILFGLLALNFVLLGLVEKFIARLKDEHWRVLPKVLVGIIIAVLIAGDFTHLFAPSDWTFFAMLLSAALLLIYKTKRFDFLILTALMISVGFHFVFNLVLSAFSVEGIGLVAIITLFMLFGMLWLLFKWFKTQYGNAAVPAKWLIILGGMFALSMASLFLLLSIGGGREPASFAIMALIFAGISVAVSPKREETSQTHALFSQLLLAESLFLLFNWLNFSYQNALYQEEPSGDPRYFLLAAVLLMGVAYYWKKAVWVRACIWFLWIGLGLIYNNQAVFYELWFQITPEANYNFSFAFMLIGIAAFYGQTRTQNARLLGILQPLSLALTTYALVFYLSHFFWYGVDVSPAMEQPDSLLSAFHLATGYAWAAFQWDSIDILLLGLVIAPALLYLLFSERKNPIALLALLAFGIGFVSIPFLLFFVSLWLLAHRLNSLKLFAFSLVVMITLLARYYYSLSTPLLYKSFLLLNVGLFFLVVVSLLAWQQRTPNPSQSAVRFSKIFTLSNALIALTSLSILFFTNYKIAKYEDVLENGESIILQLAPVDPRSIMQGDYMALDYDIIRQLNQRQHDESEKWKESSDQTISPEPPANQPLALYLLLKQDTRHVAELCAVSKTLPQDYADCQPNIYLVAKARGQYYWDHYRLPSHEFFFAEGRANHFAQAQYGEYRFKDGVVLLARLLDKDLKPL